MNEEVSSLLNEQQDEADSIMENNMKNLKEKETECKYIRSLESCVFYDKESPF